MTTATDTPTKASAYENNPFYVAVRGLELLFKNAQTIGIIFAVLMGLSALGSLPSSFVPSSTQPPMTQQGADRLANDNGNLVNTIQSVPVGVWITIAAIALAIILVLIIIGVVVKGVADYTAAQLSQGKQVGFTEAVKAVFSHFWGYLWVLTVAGVKTFLWSLLLIVPGIIMSVRYSLAGVTYFDKHLKGNAAVKESARLTKNGWLTTFASQTLFNIITFGMIELLLQPGTSAVLYRQFRDYEAKGLPKPKAHVLSWLTLVLPLSLVVFVLLLTVIFLTLASTNH